MELLVSHGANVSIDPGYEGYSILHLGVINNNPKIVDLLISHGANIDENKNNLGLTPLIMASFFNYKEIVQVLISHGANTVSYTHLTLPTN